MGARWKRIGTGKIFQGRQSAPDIDGRSGEGSVLGRSAAAANVIV